MRSQYLTPTLPGPPAPAVALPCQAAAGLELFLAEVAGLRAQVAGLQNTVTGLQAPSPPSPTPSVQVPTHPPPGYPVGGAPSGQVAIPPVQQQAAGSQAGTGAGPPSWGLHSQQVGQQARKSCSRHSQTAPTAPLNPPPPPRRVLLPTPVWLPGHAPSHSAAGSSFLPHPPQSWYSSQQHTASRHTSTQPGARAPRPPRQQRGRQPGRPPVATPVIPHSTARPNAFVAAGDKWGGPDRHQLQAPAPALAPPVTGTEPALQPSVAFKPLARSQWNIGPGQLTAQPTVPTHNRFDLLIDLGN